MLKKINSWLENRKRSYKEGLDIFNSLANASQKTTFGEFLNNVDDAENVEPFDTEGKFGILINQITMIQKRVQFSPEEFKDVVIKSVSEKNKVVNMTPPAAPKKPASLDDLPDSLAPDRARLKELIPLMAKLHADMSDEKIADDKRAELLAQLVKFDDERRAIWDRIDAFANGENLEVAKSEDETKVESNMVSVGAGIQQRITLLKGYVTRANNSITKYTGEGKQNKVDEFTEKLAAYNSELEKLQALIK